MKIVALEEHFTTYEVVTAWLELNAPSRDWPRIGPMGTYLC
jgi:hypothetical protein